LLPAWAEEEITPQMQEAVERGLAYLADAQAPDGSWSAAGGEGYRAAMTALAGLAFLAHGDLPGCGAYGDGVRRAATFLLRQADPSTGLIASPYEQRQMYGHGFAMLFLAELYGAGGDPEMDDRIRKALRRAVQLSMRSQSAWGGWYYTPMSQADEGSVTITQVQGLRAARNAGITVPAEGIRKAIDYIKNSQNPDGGIRYQAQGGGGSRPAISAAGMAVIFNAGEFHDESVKILSAGLPYVERHLFDGQQYQGHFMYMHFYAAQAMYLAGGHFREDGRSYWESYFPKVRQQLIAMQGSDGAWSDGVGPVYATALACLVLQIPYRQLPILQK
jgi:hypothetical protein